MEDKVVQQQSNLIGRPHWSSGFLMFTAKFFKTFTTQIIVLILVAQVIRYVALVDNWRIFLNNKFAFSINIPLFIIYLLYFLVIGFMFYYYTSHKEKFNLYSKTGFIFILAGGASNLFERIVHGSVVDYIFLLNGVLNFADFCIFFGLILILVSSRYNSAKV